MLYRKTPTANYSTHFNLENETSNNKIHQEVFEELHRKGSALCKKKVFRSAPGNFKVSLCGCCCFTPDPVLLLALFCRGQGSGV